MSESVKVRFERHGRLYRANPDQNFFTEGVSSASALEVASSRIGHKVRLVMTSPIYVDEDGGPDEDEHQTRVFGTGVERDGDIMILHWVPAERHWLIVTLDKYDHNLVVNEEVYLNLEKALADLFWRADVKLAYRDAVVIPSVANLKPKQIDRPPTFGTWS